MPTRSTSCVREEEEDGSRTKNTSSVSVETIVDADEKTSCVQKEEGSMAIEENARLYTPGDGLGPHSAMASADITSQTERRPNRGTEVESEKGKKFRGTQQDLHLDQSRRFNNWKDGDKVSIDTQTKMQTRSQTNKQMRYEQHTAKQTKRSRSLSPVTAPTKASPSTQAHAAPATISRAEQRFANSP